MNERHENDYSDCDKEHAACDVLDNSRRHHHNGYAYDDCYYPAAYHGCVVCPLFHAVNIAEVA